MKYLSALLFFFISLNTFSQDLSKPQYYFDTQNKPIEKTDYLKKAKDPKYTYIPRIIENDTAIVGTLYWREEIGVMPPEQRLEVIKNLELLTGQVIDTNKTIIINFYFDPAENPRGSCIDHYTGDGKYKRELKRNDDQISQFFLTESGYKYKKDFVYTDKDRLIENLLFPVEMQCGNYIIIKPNGHFLRHFSEYLQDEIIDKAKADW